MMMTVIISAMTADYFGLAAAALAAAIVGLFLAMKRKLRK